MASNITNTAKHAIRLCGSSLTFSLVTINKSKHRLFIKLETLCYDNKLHILLVLVQKSTLSTKLYTELYTLTVILHPLFSLLQLTTLK